MPPRMLGAQNFGSLSFAYNTPLNSNLSTEKFNVSIPKNSGIHSWADSPLISAITLSGVTFGQSYD